MKRRALVLCLLAATVACTGPTADPKPGTLPSQKPVLSPDIAGQDTAKPPPYDKAKYDGRVVIDCGIETDGSTSQCFIVSVEGNDRFIEQSLNFAKNAKFMPAVKNGVPVRVDRQRFEVRFPADNDTNKPAIP